MDYAENPWFFKGEPVNEFPKGTEGFVYLITDIWTGKKYVGRKYTKTLRKVKGSTRRKSADSDWQKYYSSNDFIKKAAKTDPKRFKREILRICKTKGECNYFEVAEQFKRDVLSSEDYLNDNINGKYYKENVMKYGAP